MVPRHHRGGSPVLRPFSLQTCRRHYPGGPVEPRLFRLILAQAWGLRAPQRRPSPLHRGVGVRELCFEACSAFTHVTACRLAGSPTATLCHRKLPSIRYLLDRSDCYRAEQPNFPGGDFHPAGERRLSRRTVRDRFGGSARNRFWVAWANSLARGRYE